MASTTIRKFNPPHRAEHIGSFLRPPALLAKRAEFDAGKCSKNELKAVERESIAQIVEMQKKIGLKTITDGEFPRFFFFEGMFDSLEGQVKDTNVPFERFLTCSPVVQHVIKPEGNTSWICEAKLKRTKPIYKDQFEVLKSFVTPEEYRNLKITICCPQWVQLHHGKHAYKAGVYANDEEYFADLVQIYREEIAELYSIGCRNIQFDDPHWTFFVDTNVLKGLVELGFDPEQMQSMYIRTYNAILEGMPEDLTVGVHVCRGNYRNRGFMTGGYEKIAEKLLRELNVDCFYLEYDSDRAGSFQPLRYLPANKTVVLGLVSTKVPQLEDIDAMKAQVNAAAEVICSGNSGRTKAEAMDQLCISPQCGFASTAYGNLVTVDDTVKKLDLVVRASQVIWK